MRVVWLLTVLTLVCAGCASFSESLDEVRSEREAEEAAAEQPRPLPTLDAEGVASAEEFFEEARDRVVLPDFDVGDCFTVSFQTGGQGAEVVDCGERHEGEVIHRFSYDDDVAFPDEEALGERVGQECLPAFTDYTGQAFEEQAELQIGYFSPTALSWEDGDREVFCYLADAGGGELEGSRSAGG